MAAESIRRQYVMLKPMAAGANGFARLEVQARGLLLQLTCKELRSLTRSVRVFLYAGEGVARELGQAAVNAQGQATLTADLDWRDISLSPSRLEALLVVSGDPAARPLLIGLCAQQSAGSLMDAKNAMLALCERLSREARPEGNARHGAEDAALGRGGDRGGMRPPAPQSAARAAALPRTGPDTAASGEVPEPARLPPPAARPFPGEAMPREVFLSAIDPKDYLPPAPARKAPLPPPEASEERESARDFRARQRENARPAERLRPLVWPARLARLSEYFDRYAPSAVFDLPGWRFVRVPMRAGGFFAVGYLARDGRVTRIAYALPGAANQPPPGSFARYRFHMGLHGQGYWTLGQEVR